MLAVQGKKVLLKEGGSTKVVTVQDISLGDDYLSTQFVFDDQGNISEGLGKDYILETPPFFASINHEKGELTILDWLASEEIPVTIFTKDELEQGIDCTISRVFDSSVEIFKFNIPENKVILEAETIEGVIFVLPSFKFTRKNQTGWGSRLGTRLSSRDKQTKHINL